MEIDAPVDAVWDTLTDLDRYAEWNPYFREATGRLVAGETLTLRAELAPQRVTTAKARLTVVRAPAELRWASRQLLPGLLDAVHSFVLTPTTPQRTRLLQTERFSGLLLPLSGKALRQVEGKLLELNECLKTRVEGRLPS